MIVNKRNNGYNISSLLFCIVILANNSYFISIPEIYYALLVVLWTFFFFTEIFTERLIISYNIIFYLACLLSIFVNTIDAKVEVYSRFTIFFIMTSLLGPFIFSPLLNDFRKKVFIYLNNLNIIICCLSFILWATGIHHGQVLNKEYNILRPDFAGLYNHSMLLGPMSAIAILYSLCFYLTNKRSRIKYLYLIIILICFLTCLKAGSRNALLGLIVSSIFLYFKISKHYISKLFLFILSTSVILIVLYPLYSSYLEQVLGKFSYGESQGSILASRNAKWTARIEEFIDSPIFGVGYANVTHESIGVNGQIEPGSSWLSILSMTGIFGLVCYLIIYYRVFISKIRILNNNIYFYNLLAVSLFLSIYMIFEGVMMLAGTLMSAFIWLTLGLLASFKNNLLK